MPDVGRVRAGQRVAVNGAAGGVVHLAVQIAAALGAEVTGVCGTLVTNAGGSPGHVFGPIAGIVRVVLADRVVRQRLRPLPDTWTREHLLAVLGFIEAGEVTPVIDRTHPLANTAAGLRCLEQGHARGKVVVTIT